MAELSSDFVGLSSQRALRYGLPLSILCAIGAVLLAYFWKSPMGLSRLFAQTDWRYSALLVPLLIIDYVMGGLRYRVQFNGKVLARVSLWNCIRSNWANIFLGAITPCQTGGGAAQVYYLWRCGAQVAEGVIASLVCFVSTLVFFLVSGLAAFLLLPDGLCGPSLGGFIRAGLLIVSIVAMIVITGLILPRVGSGILQRISQRIPEGQSWICSRGVRLLSQAKEGIFQFYSLRQYVVRQGKGSVLLVVLLTLVLFFNKFAIGYVLLRALDCAVPPGDFLGLSCLQLSMIYFAPTPGASGIAELSSVWLMGPLIPVALLLPYALLWRLLTTVLGAVIGGFVLMSVGWGNGGHANL